MLDDKDEKALTRSVEIDKEVANEIEKERLETIHRAKDEAALEQSRKDREELKKQELAREILLDNKRKARQEALKPGPDIHETYRQGAVKVQYMKTRYKKLFEPEDPEYTLYTRSKRRLSKAEYAMRSMIKIDADIARSTDAEFIENANKEYERHMKNALYELYGVNYLYSEFLDGVVK